MPAKTSAKRAKITTVIASGFLIVILILAFISATSIYSAKTSLTGIEHANEFSQKSRTVSELSSSLIMTGLQSKNYYLSNTDKLLKKYKESKDNMMRLLAEAEKGNKNAPDVTARLKTIKKELDNYTRYFDDTVKLIKSRNDTMSAFYKQGFDMRASLTNIVEYSYQTGAIDAVYYAGKLEESIMLARFFALDFIKTSSKESEKKAINEITTKMDFLIPQAKGKLKQSYSKDQFNNFVASRENFLASFKKVAGLVHRIDKLNADMNRAGQVVLHDTAKINSDFSNKQDKLGASIYSKTSHMKGLIYTISFIGILISILFALFITRSVKKPLGGEPADMADMAELIADGDLRFDIDHSVKATGLYAAMLKMVRNLTDIAQSIRHASESVSEGSVELSGASEQLSATFNEQTLQINSIAGALEEMAVSSREVLENIDVAISKSDTASGKAAEGKEKLHDTHRSIESIKNSTTELAKTIESLSASSGEISAILNVINDIADQTNLLALNAAIEAARAGDAGRGFAVVADEVRKLAERTQDAIQEIATIITSLQNESKSASENMGKAEIEVNRGVEALDETESVFNSIADAIDDFVSSNNMITAAVQEQSEAIHNVNENVQAVAKGLEESSGALNEITSTINELSTQSDSMNSTVVKFKI